MDRFFGSFHEMKKKLTILDGKLQELTDKLKDYDSQLVKYKFCHASGHRAPISRTDAETQTWPIFSSKGLPESQKDLTTTRVVLSAAECRQHLR